MSSEFAQELAASTRELTKRWWLLILTGVLWMIYAFIVLSSSAASVGAIAALFGVGFIFGSAFEFGLASMVDSWKWVHVVFGIISLIAGITALVWPGQTFLVLAAIIGWYLLFDGIFTVVVSISSRRDDDIWWLGLVLGIAEIGIAVWAVGSSDVSVAILLVWVAVAALSRGLSDIFLGLTLHGADKQIKGYIDPTAS